MPSVIEPPTMPLPAKVMVHRRPLSAEVRVSG